VLDQQPTLAFTLTSELKLGFGGYRDTWSKITKYLFCLSSEPFTMNGKQYQSKPLKISPSICLKFDCQLECGGCCANNVLIWLPHEVKPSYVKTKKQIEVNGKLYDYFVDDQKDPEIIWQDRNIDKHFCRHLDLNSGKCGIHSEHPMTCRVEIMRFLEIPESEETSQSKYYKQGYEPPDNKPKTKGRELIPRLFQITPQGKKKEAGPKDVVQEIKLAHFTRGSFQFRMIDGFTPAQKKGTKQSRALTIGEMKQLSSQHPERYANQPKHDGIRCRIASEPSREGINDSIERLQQIKVYSDYFKIKTRIPCIIDWLENGSPSALSDPLRFESNEAIVPFQRRKLL
jgi:Fe-S-cluster containining protein